MIHVQSIVGSVRDGRAGEAVARWFTSLAGSRSDMTHETLDLRDWDLPLEMSPKPPIMGDYIGETSRRWAEKIATADAFVLITPEYNHGYPAPLKNALDHIFHEWNRKPVGFVGYGGAGGGIRAVEQLRQVVIELEMAPLRHQVTIPAVYRAFDQDGQLLDPGNGQAAGKLLDEIVWWGTALRGARASSLQLSA